MYLCRKYTDMADIKNINVKDLEVNKGQIEGLPKNPRFIRDERFEALKKSIEDAPEMLSLRELLVYPYDGKYVVIGGNMRLRACIDIGYKEIPCKVLDKETPVIKLREYSIKDNQPFGQNDWDIIANEWDAEELRGWGMELMSTDWEQLDRIEQEYDGELKGTKITVDVDSSYTSEEVEMIRQNVINAVAEYSKCKVR